MVIQSRPPRAESLEEENTQLRNTVNELQRERLELQYQAQRAILERQHIEDVLDSRHPPPPPPRPISDRGYHPYARPPQASNRGRLLTPASSRDHLPTPSGSSIGPSQSKPTPRPFVQPRQTGQKMIIEISPPSLSTTARPLPPSEKKKEW